MLTFQKLKVVKRKNTWIIDPTEMAKKSRRKKVQEIQKGTEKCRKISYWKIHENTGKLQYRKMTRSKLINKDTGKLHEAN